MALNDGGHNQGLSFNGFDLSRFGFLLFHWIGSFHFCLMDQTMANGYSYHTSAYPQNRAD